MNRLILTLAVLMLLAATPHGRAQAPSASPPGPANPLPPATLDQLLAPIALYPDALVTQIITCAANPGQVKEVSAWLKANPSLQGTPAQDAASDKGYDAAFIAIVLFPDVLHMMADKADWTTQLGKAFHQDRPGVLNSIQRLRAQAQTQGNLKTNEQQAVESVKTKSGQDVIVIQPANPQVVYVPQYNPQVVYTQPAPPPPPPSQTGGKLAAGLIGFTAGVIVGANADDDDHTHYGYGGWGYRGPALSNDGWEEFSNHREEMAEDYYEHRENVGKQRGENTAERRAAGGENQAARNDNRSENQAARTDGRAENQSARGEERSARAASYSPSQASGQTAAAAKPPADRASQRSNQGRSASASASPSTATENRSDAFSGYQKGSTERASSSRGNKSLERSSSSAGGGGGAGSRAASGGGGGGGARGGGRAK